MKRKLLFIGATIFTLFLFCFVACSSSDDSSDDNNKKSDNTIPVVDESVSHLLQFDTGNYAVRSSSDQTVIIIDSTTKYKNSKVTASDIPNFTVKTGYKLIGWYMDAAHTQAFSPFYITGNARLYAKFATSQGVDVPNYVFMYDSEYTGRGPMTTNGLLTRRMVKEIKGYPKFFCGWFYDSAYTQQASVGDTVAKDTTLYAKWVSASEVNAGSGTTFYDNAYINSVTWYKASSETNTETDDNYLTKITAFTSSTTDSDKYSLSGGLWLFEGTALYAANHNRISILAKDSKLKHFFLRDCKISVPNTSGATVDMTQVESFVAVKATKSGTVTAVIASAPNSKNTTVNSVAALVNESGKVLAAQVIDNRTAENGGQGYSGTLSANATTVGNVFLVFGTNGDAAGDIKVSSMTFTPAE